MTKKDGTKNKKNLKRKVLRGKEVKQNKRGRHGRAKILDKRIVKIEWKDRLAACSHVIILVAKVGSEFIKGDGPAYFKIWMDMEVAGFSTYKRIKTEVIGDVSGLYRERIEDSLVMWITQGPIREPLPGYFENVIYTDRKYGLKVKIDRT